MPNPPNEAHVKAFKWFALGWLLAVAGSSLVVVLSGAYEWAAVSSTAFRLGVMPILTGFLVVGMTRWLSRYQQRYFPQE
jgi:hypothetical protein